MKETLRAELDRLKAYLENERASFLPHWRELGDFLLPRRPRFLVSDVNKGDRRSQKIIDSTAQLAIRTFKSGMMSGATSPSRPWFRLDAADPLLSKIPDVKIWLHEVTERMHSVFLRSNLYTNLPVFYGDFAVFGTAAMGIEEDFEDVLRTNVFPIGSYMIANDERLKVNTFMRTFRMTVRQLVQKFAKKDDFGKLSFENISSRVKSLWENKSYEEWVDVCHAIIPNPDYDPEGKILQRKKFLSLYYEESSEDPEKFLRKSGYDFFPVLIGRWEVTGEDVYATDCPGMTALGDVKQLQMEQRRKAQGIEKGINPPMVAPVSLKNAKASILPGDITYLDEREGQKSFRAAHEINFQMQYLLHDIREVQERISKAFYEDLFLMLANLDRRQITATEVEERAAEKLTGLGPVLERLNQDVLNELIDISFYFMLQQGFIPDPPHELEGESLKVEYVSVMAQSQKLAGIAGLERFTGYLGSFMKLNPEILDKVNIEAMIEDHAERIGIDPKIMRSDEEVMEIRAQRAEAMKSMKTLELIKSGAGAMKDLSSAKLDDENILSKLTGAK